MHTSDSEDFESADEGHGSVEKKERKKRNSSSNYSDNALETVAESKVPSPGVESKQEAKENVKQADGWDDFEIDEDEPVAKSSSKISATDKPSSNQDKANTNPEKPSTNPENPSSNLGKPSSNPDKPSKATNEDAGWDDFGDWGDDENAVIHRDQPRASNHDNNLKQMTDKLASMSTGPAASSWGWGWGVDSILSTASAGLTTATAGITTLTHQINQGITNVLETGIGAPDPEELARISKEKEKESEAKEKTPEQDKKESKEEGGTGDAAFDPFGSILKFVGTTGSKVITGGLDTLETIGRKTFEVLQEGDPHLAKKRALLGLDPSTPVLSQVLREAKAKAEEEDQIREERREAKEIHYERLFDDFEGLVHLEALEMLAKQVNMQIEERLQGATGDKKYEMKETLQQVSELCEIPEDEDDNDEEEEESNLPKDELFLEHLLKATEDLGVKLQFQALVRQYKDILDWLANPDSDLTIKSVHKHAVSSLAQATAYSVEIYHKAGEMLLVKPRRLTADESDAMTQLTQVLCKHIGELARLYTTTLDSVSTGEMAAESNNYITNIFLQAGNSSTYIKNAFILTHPILQIGAI
ncbi:hypothetical protein O0L34_g10379 [Tuta absoluta]|nr:hypothetical protein O0L34_g10379 [Tuta absoluta]